MPTSIPASAPLEVNAPEHLGGARVEHFAAADCLEFCQQIGGLIPTPSS
jgi:hypothetical protein